MNTNFEFELFVLSYISLTNPVINHPAECFLLFITKKKSTIYKYRLTRKVDYKLINKQMYERS